MTGIFSFVIAQVAHVTQVDLAVRRVTQSPEHVLAYVVLVETSVTGWLKVLDNS